MRIKLFRFKTDSHFNLANLLIILLNQPLLFWITFIFTRPFGATFGDLLTKPVSKGGLELGTIPASLITTFLLGLLIIYATRKHNAKKTVI